MFRSITTAVAIAYASAAAGAQQGPASPATSAAGGAQVECKYVVSHEKGAKPFRMCRTKAEWAAKEAKDAKDANRIVCRYEDKPGTKLVSRKVCQPASEWAAQRAASRDTVLDIQMRTCVPGAGC